MKGTATRKDIWSVDDFFSAMIAERGIRYPVLLSRSCIDQHTVPDGLYLYEIETDFKGNIMLRELSQSYQTCKGMKFVIFTYSVVSSVKFTLYGKNKCKTLTEENYQILGWPISLADYCKMRNVETVPAYLSISAPSEEEVGNPNRFYAIRHGDEGSDARVGHVRIDFGRDGNECWHTWWDQDENKELVTDEFNSDLTKVMTILRRFVLKDIYGMYSYCCSNGTRITAPTEYPEQYGFVIETEHYKYYLRCNYRRGCYNAYLNCFRKDLL